MIISWLYNRKGH